MNPHLVANDALQAVRELSAHYRCRIELSSDGEGSLGNFCCCASDKDRDYQGFGSTVEAAVENYRKSTKRKTVPASPTTA